MKHYMAIFLGTPNAVGDWRKNMTPEIEAKMKEGMMAWGKWMEDHKADIVYVGSPLGKTKKVNKDGISDTKNELGAYVVVQAVSHDESAKMFLNHPHFMIFPGDRVEVMEQIAIPKM